MIGAFYKYFPMKESAITWNTKKKLRNSMEFSIISRPRPIPSKNPLKLTRSWTWYVLGRPLSDHHRLMSTLLAELGRIANDSRFLT